MPDKDPLKYFESEVKRLNYFNSQFLVDKDFNDEQLYHNQMRRLHNRALHAWGIVQGLEVSRASDAGRVTVSPGIAVDRLGREIVLAAQSDALDLAAVAAGAKAYVTVAYADAFDAADKDINIKDTQTAGDYYTRTTERPTLAVSASAPAADSAALLLAVVALDGKRAVAEIDRSVRRYSGSRFGSSDGGGEFSLYADTAGAWHFFDGGRGADRLTVDGRGNVGVGTPTPGFPLSFPNVLGDKISLWGQSGNHYGFGIQGALLQIHADTSGADIAFGYGSSESFAETMRIKGNGNVGIGTAPGQKLQVKGTIYSESGGFMFPDGTTQATAASSARIPAENVAAGNVGANVGGGVYTFPAALYWGNSASRTDTKDDASAQASRSGFFETVAPVNYYAGASSWQHLIEARHSNNGNNYALQIAGSFYDQNLYMRKTNGDGKTKWSQFVLANSDGWVGVGTNKPVSRLHVHGDYLNTGAGGITLDATDGDNPEAYVLRINPVALGNSMVGYQFQTKSVVGGTNVPLSFDNAGRVGAGVTRPLGPLSVGDSSVDDSNGYIVVGRKVKGGGSRHVRIGFDNSFNFVIGDYGFNNTAGPWVTQFGINYQAPNSSLYIDAHGFVGIGTLTPGFPLNFPNTLGDKISLWGQTGNHYGFGIQGNLLQIYTDGIGSDIAFGYGMSASFTEIMRLTNGGLLNVNGRITRHSQNFSFAGTAGHNQLIPAPWGTVNDWNIFVSPRTMGFQESGHESDNALLVIECYATQDGGTAWRVTARFRHRWSNDMDGVWSNEKASPSGTVNLSVNYLLVPR